MKSKTFRVLVVLMAILLIGGMMASCKKEIIKPEKATKHIPGNWDMFNTVENPYQLDQNDGVVDRVLGEENEVVDGWKYRVEGSTMVFNHYNEVQQQWQANDFIYDFSMPHQDTLILDGKIYCRL